MSFFYIQLIAGCSVGFEFPECEQDEKFLLTVDLLFIRLTFVVLEK